MLPSCRACHCTASPNRSRALAIDAADLAAPDIGVSQSASFFHCEYQSGAATSASEVKGSQRARVMLGRSDREAQVRNKVRESENARRPEHRNAFFEYQSAHVEPATEKEHIAIGETESRPSEEPQSEHKPRNAN